MQVEWLNSNDKKAQSNRIEGVSDGMIESCDELAGLQSVYMQAFKDLCRWLWISS